jgi:hypothetical protein
MDAEEPRRTEPFTATNDQQLLHGGPDAVLGRPSARRRRDRLRGAGEVEEVRALGVVEPERPGDAVGGAGQVDGPTGPARDSESTWRRS